MAKAIIPLLPIILLVVDSMAGSYSVGRFLPGPSRILAAMLIGIAAAGLIGRGKVGGLATAFFDGAGYGYTHVISLIVVASTFAAGVELSGLIRLLLKGMSAWPSAALVAAPMASCFLAVVAGSGIAPAVAIMDFFVPAAGSMGLDAIDLGAVTSLGCPLRPHDEPRRRGRDDGRPPFGGKSSGSSMTARCRASVDWANGINCGRPYS